MRRLIRWLVFVGVLGGLGWGATAAGVSWYRKRSTPRFLTAEVTRGRVETAVNSTGTVKAVRTISVGSFVSGPIKRVYADYNSFVEKGQLLAEIDPRLFEASVRRDEAALRTQRSELDRVKALLRQAENNEERGRRLMKINKDYLSDAEFDQLRANRESLEAQLELARASIEQAEANLGNSRANLDYTKIVAPEPGVVIERKVEDGQTVASTFQTPEMFTLAVEMDKRMHLFASVDEADIGLITRAQKDKRPVTFSVDAYPQETFHGKIYQIRKNSTTTQNVVTYPVVIEAKNPDMKLFPGMTASITFQLEAKENVLRLPTSALRYVPPLNLVRPEDRRYLEGTATAQPDSGVKLSAGEKTALAKARYRRIVWVKGEGGLRAVPAALGLMDNQFAELLSGDLSEGDALVTGVDAAGGQP